MINTSHPRTTPHDTETASELDSAAGQAGTVGDWAASLAKLLKVAFREFDMDRERARASIAKAALLLRVQIERSSFDPAHNRAGAGRLLPSLIAIDVTRRKRRHLATRKQTSHKSRGWRRWVNSPRPSPMRSISLLAQSQRRPLPVFDGWNATSLFSMKRERAWPVSSVTPGAQGMWFEGLRHSPRGPGRNNPRST
jgi:hypothetical protein